MTWPLPEDQFLALPLLVIRGTEHNSPATYSALQNFLLPWLPALHMAWWLTLTFVATYLVSRFLVLPSLQRQQCPPAPAVELARHQPRWQHWLEGAFSLGEIRADVALRLFGGAILLGFLVTFDEWIYNASTTRVALQHGFNICWPFIPNCGDLLWMKTLPEGYSQPTLFMGFFAIIVTGAWALLTKRIGLAHTCIGILLLARLYLMASYGGYKGNFDYYHTVFCLIYLFLPHKRFFGSLSIPLFYTLSTVAKIHPSWTWGGYFGAMELGLPLFPLGTEPFFTNLVIFMEMVMAWFLFSRIWWLQRGVFFFFCVFHIYSGLLVGYHYPTIVMPPLLIFFGTLYKPFHGAPRDAKALPGWLLVGTLALLQFSPKFIPGDEKLTLEGNFNGLYMFEANHQCEAKITDADGRHVMTFPSSNPRNRCDPWDILQMTRQRLCHTERLENGPSVPSSTYRLEFIHSINGGPFYKIVDEPDLCRLKYKPFGRNDWIQDETTAPMVGRPNKNRYQ